MTSKGVSSLIAIVLPAVVLLSAGFLIASEASPRSFQGETSDPDLIAAAITESREITDGPSNPALGDVSSPGALEFPAGTSYAEALRELYMAERLGKAPAGVRLVSSLPRGAVVLRDPGADTITIELSAPNGYLPEAGDRIQRWNLAYPAGATKEEIAEADRGRQRPEAPWAKGRYVLTPDLPDCMTITDRDAPTAACEAGLMLGGVSADQEPLP